jgi:hypothetical protein
MPGRLRAPTDRELRAARVRCRRRRARSRAFPSGSRSAPTPARTPVSAPLRPRGRVLPSNSPLLARGEPIRRRRGNHEGPCVMNRIFVARGFGLDTRVFCKWNRRRTRTGLLRVGRHSWPLSSKRSRANARGREFPKQGTSWRRPIGRRSRHRLGRLVSDRLPVTVHLFAQSRYACSNEEFNRFASSAEPGDTARQVRLFESPPPIPSVGPVVRA